MLTRKRMLYDFYRTQLKKKPDSLHATYLLTGRRLVRHDQTQSGSSLTTEDGADSHMQSSPLPASSAPGTQEDERQRPSWIRVVSIVKEEQLDGEI